MREFGSFEELAAFLERQAAVAKIEVTKAVHEAGALIQREAKDEIGHYQGQDGPFPSWPPLADTTLNGYTDARGTYRPGKVDMGYAPPDNPLLRTGELRDAIEMVADSRGAVVGVRDRIVGSGAPEDPARNVGDVAVFHEFGTAKMPARSFLGRAAYKKAEEAAGLIAHAFVSAITGRPNLRPSHDAPDEAPS